MAINGHHHRDANRSSGCRNKRCRQNAEDSRMGHGEMDHHADKFRGKIAGKNCGKELAIASVITPSNRDIYSQGLYNAHSLVDLARK
jgi:hypothetical protein